MADNPKPANLPSTFMPHLPLSPPNFAEHGAFRYPAADWNALVETCGENQPFLRMNFFRHWKKPAALAKQQLAASPSDDLGKWRTDPAPCRRT